MLNSELLADLQKHKHDLVKIGMKSGKELNALLDRFLRDFCDDSQRLTSMSGNGKAYTNFESAKLLAIRLNELS